MSAVAPGTPRRRVETDPWDRVFETLRGLDRRIATLERGQRAVAPVSDSPTVETLAADLAALSGRVDSISPTD